MFRRVLPALLVCLLAARAFATSLILPTIIARSNTVPLLVNGSLTTAIAVNQPVINLPTGEVDLVFNVGPGGTNITFTVADADPLNASTTITGGQSVTSAAIPASTNGLITLSPTHSSAVVVTWSGTGTFTGSYLTLVVKSGASSSSGGSSSGGGGGGGSTTAATTYYVNASTGSDTNTCLTSGAACLTIQHACDIIPSYICYPTTVSIAAGTYSAGCNFNGRTFGVCPKETISASVGPYIAFKGTAVQASNAGIMAGTIASATQAGQGILAAGGVPGLSNWGTATVTGAGWTVNNLKGLRFCVLTGTGAGECSEITSNTATVATIAGGWAIATPTGGAATFQIQTTPSSIINGVIAKPPGAFQYPQSYSATNGAAFYFEGLTGAGYRAGDDVGFGGDTGSNSVYSNTAFTDVPISIQNIAFEGGDNTVFASVQGPILVGLRWNEVQEGVAFAGNQGASGYIESNLLTGDSSGNNKITNGNYANSKGVPSGGFIWAYGNYVPLASSGDNNAFAYVATPGLFMQNYVIGTGTATENGLVLAGGAQVTSIGNEWNNLVEAIDGSLISSGWATAVNDDGDDFTNNVTAVYVYGNHWQFRVENDPITGSGNTTAFNVQRGGALYFTSAGTYTSIGTTDFLFGTNSASYSGTQLYSATPHALFDMSVGTSIYSE